MTCSGTIDLAEKTKGSSGYGWVIGRVELLRRVGRLLFHLQPHPASSSITEGLWFSEAPLASQLQLLMQENNTVICLIKKASAMKAKDHTKLEFRIKLPFPVKVVSVLDSFYRSSGGGASGVPVKRTEERVLTFGFKLVDEANKPASQEDHGGRLPPMLLDVHGEELMDSLDRKLSQLWDAKKLKEITGVLCKSCQRPLLNPLPTDPTDEGEALNAALSKLQLEQPAATSPSQPKPSSPSILFHRVRDLPSEGWEEMLDCWVCHAEDYTPKFNKLFQPDLNTLLVGATYLLCNQNRWAGPEPPNPKEVLCCHCHHQVGEVVIVEEANLSPIIKLYKLEIQPELHGGEKKIAPLPPMANLLLDLLSNYRHHSITRFMIVDRATQRPKLMLNVLNFEVFLWCSPPTYTIAGSASVGAQPTCSTRALGHAVRVQLTEMMDAGTTEGEQDEEEGVARLYYSAAYIRTIVKSVVKTKRLAATSPPDSETAHLGYLYV